MSGTEQAYVVAAVGLWAGEAGRRWGQPYGEPQPECARALSPPSTIAIPSCCSIYYVFLSCHRVESSSHSILRISTPHTILLCYPIMLASTRRGLGRTGICLQSVFRRTTERRRQLTFGAWGLLPTRYNCATTWSGDRRCLNGYSVPIMLCLVIACVCMRGQHEIAGECVMQETRRGSLPDAFLEDGATEARERWAMLVWRTIVGGGGPSDTPSKTRHASGRSERTALYNCHGIRRRKNGRITLPRPVRVSSCDTSGRARAILVTCASVVWSRDRARDHERVAGASRSGAKCGRRGCSSQQSPTSPTPPN
eukprot:2301356-Rhodomonas_salina.3